MDQTTHTDAAATYFDTSDYSPMTIPEKIDIAIPAVRNNEVVLDGLLTTIKWVFLYLPGALAIHFSMMMLSLFVFYNDWFSELLLGTFGIVLVSSFLVMFGLGKLSDLKYLRVVGALVAAGGVASVSYSILTALTGGDFFGWFTLFSFPLALFIAYLVKKNTDSNFDYQ